MDDLFSQLDSKNHAVQAETATVLNEMQINEVANGLEKAPKQDSKARHKARQARKAATLADKYAPTDEVADARIQKEAADEEKTINRLCEQLGVQLHEITPDGHCLFSAVADQLALLGILPASAANYTTVRRAAADYIQSHPDDFLPFLPSTEGEDAVGSTDAGLMTPPEFNKYCAQVRSSAVWGGEPEILALSRAYNIPIHVVQGEAPNIVVHSPTGDPTAGTHQGEPTVLISYHRRLYGLGEHYNSLRPKTGIIQGIKNVIS